MSLFVCSQGSIDEELFKKKVGNTGIDQKDILAMCQGDEDAFARIYDQMAAPAIRYAAAMVRHDQLSADAVQEAFLRVYRKRETFDVQRPFEPWFYRILINECRRVLRFQKRLYPVEKVPERSAPKKDGDLYECIGNLPANLREPLVLRYLLGYRDKEVAELLNISLAAAKGRVKRAREQLRAMLKGRS